MFRLIIVDNLGAVLNFAKQLQVFPVLQAVFLRSYCFLTKCNL